MQLTSLSPARRKEFDRYNITNQADVKEAVSRLDRQKTVRVDAEIEPEEGSTRISEPRPN